MDNLIFISCGQRTEEEISLGRLAKSIVDATPGFEGYFAQYSQSLDALAVNIFEAIERCAGAIIFLQNRGKVTYDLSSYFTRSSVWVNQEIAILAFRRHFEAKQIPILAFSEPELELEGAMTALIVNPNQIESPENVAAYITKWLATDNFPLNGAHERFQDKWTTLKNSQDDINISRSFLRALIDEGGVNVKVSSVQGCMKERYNIEKDARSADSVKSLLERLELIKRIQNLYTGEEVSINPTWQWHIRRMLSKEEIPSI